jgi:hypothetical protein
MSNIRAIELNDGAHIPAAWRRTRSAKLCDGRTSMRWSRPASGQIPRARLGALSRRSPSRPELSAAPRALTELRLHVQSLDDEGVQL